MAVHNNLPPQFCMCAHIKLVVNFMHNYVITTLVLSKQTLYGLQDAIIGALKLANDHTETNSLGSLCSVINIASNVTGCMYVAA